MKLYSVNNAKLTPVAVAHVLASLEAGAWILLNKWDNVHVVVKIIYSPPPAWMRAEWEIILPPGTCRADLEAAYNRLA